MPNTTPSQAEQQIARMKKDYTLHSDEGGTPGWWHIRENELLNELHEAERRVWREAAALIPTSWCDELLTGNGKAIGEPPFKCADIERLLLQIRDRLERQAKPPAQEGKE